MKASWRQGVCLVMAVSLVAPLLVMVGCGSERAGHVPIRVQLQHSHADRVVLVYAHNTDVGEIPMVQVADGTYEASVAMPQKAAYLINFKATSDLYPETALWIIRNSGIDARMITVNGVAISNDFLVMTGQQPPAAVSVVRNGDDIGVGSGHVRLHPNTRIPPEVPGHTKYVRLRLPPQGFTAALPWLQALHTGSSSDASTVEVDSITLLARTAQGDVLLLEDGYARDMPVKGFDHGGTYLRHPFLFDEANSNWPMPASVRDGCLVVEPHVHPDRVFHWWTSRRAVIPADAQFVTMIAKVRVTGDACVQAGIDFWRDASAPYAGKDGNNTEAGLSDWIFASDEWQTLVLSTEHLIPWGG